MFWGLKPWAITTTTKHLYSVYLQFPTPWRGGAILRSPAQCRERPRRSSHNSTLTNEVNQRSDSLKRSSSTTVFQRSTTASGSIRSSIPGSIRSSSRSLPGHLTGVYPVIWPKSIHSSRHGLGIWRHSDEQGPWVSFFFKFSESLLWRHW